MPNIARERAVTERVLIATHADDLDQIRDDGVQAVLFVPHDLPEWIDELAAAMDAGTFEVPRTILHGCSPSEIESCIDRLLARSVLSPGAAAGLKMDILGMVETCRRLTAATRYRFRCLTDTPNCDCGFHVDTVAAHVPTTGLLRVYCGPATEYVDPPGVTSWMDFYRYVFDRHQLRHTIETSEGEACELARARRDKLDNFPPFIEDTGCLKVVPDGSVVSFRLVDSRFLWSAYLDTRRARGWIHRSPMRGARRFMVSINAV